ncbi:MAG: tRNA (N6-threonylcarbamoyladenosine(37)-N6)-methyltransferase TrmO [Methanomicrobiales archaeon]|nr:tRNA (N6-threonylcarbamoyladenosine(37)-N6)-methyltransferase TrmO [Methanomicrobiales archaeon]
MQEMTLTPVGVVRSPYRNREDAPRQGRLSPVESIIEIHPAYGEALRDIADHPHLLVFTWFHRSRRDVLSATPPGSRKEHGVFAIRAPERPNPIGLCLVDLVKVEGLRLTVRGLDAIDGTPVVDIKPFHRDIDCPPAPPDE